MGLEMEIFQQDGRLSSATKKPNQ